jgi:hypothetical protein
LPPAMPLPLSACEELNCVSLSKVCKRHTKNTKTKVVWDAKANLAAKGMVNPARKRTAATKASDSTWSAKVSDEITLAAADLTEEILTLVTQSNT